MSGAKEPNEIIQWATVRRKVNSLKPYERNPRKITPEAYERLKQKMIRNGFHGGIKATKEGLIIGGHQRIKILKEFEVQEIDVITAPEDLTDEQYREVLLSDNISEGEFDTVLLQDFEMADLELVGIPDFVLDEMFTPEPKPKKEIEDNGKFMCLVEFDTEAEQETFYGEMTERGLLCKLMS
jgi:Mg2+ and Co2+ transporter CorA